MTNTEGGNDEDSQGVGYGGGRISADILSRRKRAVIIGAWAAAILVPVTAVCGWLGVTASAISSNLQGAMHLAGNLKNNIVSDDPRSASATVSGIMEHTAAAREASSNPVWTLASAVPVFGQNFQAATEAATSADDVATLGLKPLVTVFQTLDWENLLPARGGIDLSALATASPKLESAAYAVRESADRLRAIDIDGLLPQLSTPLMSARGELESLRAGLDVASDVAAIAPDMMGNDSPRRYLLLIQNNAEARATGGIPGALAVLTSDDGKLSLTGQSSASALGVMTPVLNVDTEQRQIYTERLGKFMQDVNLTPDFPTSAQLAQEMWERKTGQQVDGVLSIDPVGLGYLLHATGPVKVSDPKLVSFTHGKLPSTLSSANAVKTLLSDVYAVFPNPADQDAYFAAVAKGLFDALSDGRSDGRKVIEGLTHAVEEQRIMAWSARQKEQETIVKYPLGGSISGANTSPAQFGVYFNDGTGAKMDYYVKRTARLIKQCGTTGYARIKVRVTSTNTAPNDAASSLPAYVTGGGAFGVPAGTVQTNLVAYGPVQSNVDSVVADGKKISFGSQFHSSRPVGIVTIALPPGKSSTIDFVFDKIVQTTEPKLSVTPTVHPREDVVLDTISRDCVLAPQ